MLAQIKRYADIFKNATANMIAKTDKITDYNEGSITFAYLDTASRIAERLYTAIRQKFNELLQLLPYSLFGMTKKNGTAASGTVLFKREKGLNAKTVIVKGIRVSGGGYTFVTTTAGEIAAGNTESAPISAICETLGKVGNVKAGVITSIESTVPADIIGVENRAAFTGGADEETDSEFQTRFQARVNGFSGTNEYAIRYNALSVDTVRSVTTENHKPPLKNIYNISIYVDDGSGSASDETLEKVRLVIEGDGTTLYPGHLAPGVNARIIAPTSIPVNVSLNAVVFDCDFAEAKEEIETLVTEYVNSLPIAGVVIVSEIIKKVMTLSYVKDVLMITPTQNVEPLNNQIARIGTLNVNVIESND